MPRKFFSGLSSFMPQRLDEWFLPITLRSGENPPPSPAPPLLSEGSDLPLHSYNLQDRFFFEKFEHMPACACNSDHQATRSMT